MFPPHTLDEMDARGEIYWSPTGNPRRKIYLDESQGIYVQDIWLEFRDAHNQNIQITGYPTEKNFNLIARIVDTSSNDGDLGLDCFSGSGTTLAGASQSGRRWIGIDSSVEAIGTTLRRFAKGTERMGDFVSARAGREQSTNGTYTYPLFNLRELHEKRKAFTTITDFSLHASEPYSGELDAILAQWKIDLDI